jgi:hypothetical protein
VETLLKLKKLTLQKSWKYTLLWTDEVDILLLSTKAHRVIIDASLTARAPQLHDATTDLFSV